MTQIQQVNNVVINNLLALMKERGVIAYKLTTDLSISSNAITEWTKGKASPSRKTLLKLCEYFEVPLSYFYQESELQAICTLLDYDEQQILLQFIYSQFPRLKK